MEAWKWSNVILRNERGQLMPGTGINGNPKLAGHGLSLLAVKQREQIIADLGGEAVLSATDLIRIDEAVRLMQRGRRAKSAEDAAPRSALSTVCKRASSSRSGDAPAQGRSVRPRSSDSPGTADDLAAPPGRHSLFTQRTHRRRCDGRWHGLWRAQCERLLAIGRFRLDGTGLLQAVTVPSR